MYSKDQVSARPRAIYGSESILIDKHNPPIFPIEAGVALRRIGGGIGFADRHLDALLHRLATRIVQRGK